MALITIEKWKLKGDNFQLNLIKKLGSGACPKSYPQILQVLPRQQIRKFVLTKCQKLVKVPF